MTQLVPGGTTAAGGEVLSPPAAGVDTGSRRERDADELAHRLVAALDADPRTHRWRDSLVVTTHVVGRDERRHVALSVAADADADAFTAALAAAARELRRGLGDPDRLALVTGHAGHGPDDLRAGAEDAVQAWAARRGGRAVHFPGVRTLTGEVTVAQLLAGSAVQRVRVLASGDADPSARLLTRDFVRPVWLGGHLVLHAQPARGGVLVPFEVPDPTPCCADHT